MQERAERQFHFIKEEDLVKKFVPVMEKELTRNDLKARNWEKIYGLIETDDFPIGGQFNFPVIDPQGGFMATVPGPAGSFLVRFDEKGNEKQIKELKMNRSAPKFSPDGQKILFIEQGAYGAHIVTMDRTNQVEGKFFEGNQVSSASFFGDNEKIVTNLDNNYNDKIVILDIKKQKQIFAKEEFGKVYLPRQNNDGKKLVYLMNYLVNNELKIWDIETGESREYRPNERILDLAMSPSGKILAIKTDEDPIDKDGRRIDFYCVLGLDLKKIGEYVCKEYFKHFSFSNDGSRIIVQVENGVKIFSISGK